MIKPSPCLLRGGFPLRSTAHPSPKMKMHWPKNNTFLSFANSSLALLYENLPFVQPLWMPFSVLDGWCLIHGSLNKVNPILEFTCLLFKQTWWQWWDPRQTSNNSQGQQETQVWSLANLLPSPSFSRFLRVIGGFLSAGAQLSVLSSSRSNWLSFTGKFIMSC